MNITLAVLKNSNSIEHYANPSFLCQNDSSGMYINDNFHLTNVLAKVQADCYC